MKAALGLVLSIALVGCGGNDTASTRTLGSASAPLEGGRLALPTDYPAVVSVGFCTATKVGPRHFLMAEHCLSHVQDSLMIESNGGHPQVALDVAEITTSLPTWDPQPPGGAPWGPDVALLRMWQDSPNIPLALIDPTPVNAGDPVTKAGWGCEHPGGEPGPFKLQETTSIAQNFPTWAPSFTFTHRLLADPISASLCPGDSGGPLLRTSATEILVVGVNSRGGGTLDYHSRLDDGAYYPTHSLLASKGARFRVASTATPFSGSGHLLTGNIEAEQFDVGTEGAAYHDLTSGNTGTSQYRETGVDLFASATAGNGTFVRAAAGEWLRYALDAGAGGTFDFTVRLSGTPAPNALQLELDGQPASEVISASDIDASGWHTVTFANVALAFGHNALKLKVLSALDIDSFGFAPSPAATCSDGMRNGQESDSDCGGRTCQYCEAGQHCNTYKDCESGVCNQGQCANGPVEVDTGEDFACGRFADGLVRCWGSNALGQLGLLLSGSVGDQPGEMSTSMTAVQLSGHATSIALGDKHACAILADGSVECWGNNSRGQLGAGDTAPHLAEPVAVSLGGTAFSLALGAEFSCALLTDGAVKCWGDNFYGQLGVGHKNSIGDQPGEMGAALVAIALPPESRTGITAGAYHACAYAHSGSVRCWGHAAEGQLGFSSGQNYGDTTSELVPPAVALGTSFAVQQVSAGIKHTCAVSALGKVKCWGDSSFGQLGYGDTATRGLSAATMGDNLPQLQLGASVKQIDARYLTTCVAFNNGAAKCWGLGAQLGQPGLASFGVIGDSPNEVSSPVPWASSPLPPIALGTNRKVESLSTAGMFNCVKLLPATLGERHDLKCWGMNQSGQLGAGDTATRGSQASHMGDDLTALVVP